MGLFAPVAAYLAARIGTRRAMTIGLALIGVFGVLRATMPSAWLVVLLTWPVGIGMGFGNAIAPISVKEHFEERPAFGTGVYTTGIQVGSTSAAALAVPLAGWLYGWRGALIAISCVALCSLVAWVVLTWGEHRTPCRRLGAAAAVAQRHRLAPRRDLRADGLGVLRPQRVAPGCLHRARLERGQRRVAAGDDEPDRDPGLVRDPVPVGPNRPARARSCSASACASSPEPSCSLRSPGSRMRVRSSPASPRAGCLRW